METNVYYGLEIEKSLRKIYETEDMMRHGIDRAPYASVMKALNYLAIRKPNRLPNVRSFREIYSIYDGKSISELLDAGEDIEAFIEDLKFIVKMEDKEE